MQKIHEKTEIKVSVLAAFAGVSKSTWHEWQTRKGIETRHNHETPKLNWYTPEERTAVVKYVLTHKNFMYGYRYFAWQMTDENVAFVRPASVYNIMKESINGLKMKERQRKKALTSPRLRMSSGIKIFHTSRFLVCFIILSA